MNEIKNLSRKSARPATIATENQKQTMSLTTMSTDDGMNDKVLLRVCQKVCIKSLLYICMKNELYKELFDIFVVYL